MVYQKLVDYLSEGLKKGFKIELLKQKLLSSGFQEKEINEAINFIQSNNTQKTEEDKKIVKYRNIFLVYLFSIITFGIYLIYWVVSTKNEINRLGGKIPTAWLLIIPIANLYWIYKYCEGFAQNIKKDNNTILWFILYLLVGIIMPAIIQSELNKLS